MNGIAAGVSPLFDPAQLLQARRPGLHASAERLIVYLRRFAGTDMRLVLLPQASTSYVRALLVSLAASAWERATSLDGTLPADEEFEAAAAAGGWWWGGSSPLRDALRQHEAEALFGLPAVPSAARRLFVLIAARERFVRVEGAGDLDGLRSAARLLVYHVSGGRVEGALDFLRALLAQRLLRRAALWGQALLLLATLAAMGHNRLMTAVHQRRLRAVDATSLSPATSCGVCLGTAEEDCDGSTGGGSPSLGSQRQPRRWQHYACGHVFHVDCGDRWLARSNVCPLCRRENPKGCAPSRALALLRPLLQFLAMRSIFAIISFCLSSFHRTTIAFEGRV